MMNQFFPTNTRGHLASYPTNDMLFPKAHSEYPPTVLMADAAIAVGDELFTSYGGNDWFSDRNITVTTPIAGEKRNRPLEELSRVGHCLTNIEIRRSGFVNAGNGIFAKKDFNKGDVVTISPALVIPKSILVKAKARSVVVNYAITTDESDVAVLPFGRGILANNGNKEGFNMILKWYDWERRDIIDNAETVFGNWTILAAAPSASVFVAQQATRDIKAGEELTIFYGSSWEKAWMKYVDKRNRAHLKGMSTPQELQKISFRHPIGAPDGMFPEHWLRTSTNSNSFVPEEELISHFSRSEKSEL